LGDLACPQHLGLFDSKQLVNDRKGQLNRGINRIPAVDSGVAVKDFWRTSASVTRRSPLAIRLSSRIYAVVLFVRRSNQIHRNV